MKALKAKEIRERLERIKKEGGKSVREDGKPTFKATQKLFIS